MEIEDIEGLFTTVNRILVSQEDPRLMVEGLSGPRQAPMPASKSSPKETSKFTNYVNQNILGAEPELEVVSPDLESWGL